MQCVVESTDSKIGFQTSDLGNAEEPRYKYHVRIYLERKAKDIKHIHVCCPQLARECSGHECACSLIVGERGITLCRCITL